MAVTIGDAIESIESVLDGLPQDWYEEGVPTFETLHMTGGILQPYFVVSYGDVIQQGSTAFAGTRGDDHVLPVRFMAVAPTAKIARQLRVKLTDVFTGFTPDYCGEMTKRGGGGTYTVTNANDVIVAYVAPVNFRTTINLDVAV